MPFLSSLKSAHDTYIVRNGAPPPLEPAPWPVEHRPWWVLVADEVRAWRWRR